VYRVTTDQRSQPQVDALSPAALSSFAEARVTLAVAPWGGDPINDDTPDGPVRTLSFGSAHQGLITYLILDHQRRVDLLDVLWIG
jgi:hypothetical protein